MRILFLTFLVCCQGCSSFRHLIPKRSASSFYIHVLSDPRWIHSDYMVVYVTSAEYVGYTVSLGQDWMYLLNEMGKIKAVNDFREAAKILNPKFSFEIDKTNLEKLSFDKPPANSLIYESRSLSTKEILEKYFNDDLSIKSTMSWEDELALTVIFFERRIALYSDSDGRGTYIDLNANDWAEYQMHFKTKE